MKSRSHRLPTISDTPDDWVDESWTVDCVCGVNFDDGEEMVDCDECGVWVHTRCSRYVKSEKLFSCDKCKSKKLRKESEETEVAQLLVELPTKTLRMDNPYPMSCPPQSSFQVWTEIPLEEKVHVQGIPGGDPALFSGVSPLFSQQLWKCTGYVPKKFNSQYREFPCWDERQDDDDDDDDDKDNEELENPACKGADALFSLSTSGGNKSHANEGGVLDMGPPTTDTKKQDVRKERSLLKPIVIHSSHQKKDDSKVIKDQNRKKNVKAMDKYGDSKKRSFESVSTMSTDAKQSESYEGKDHKASKTDKQSCKPESSRTDVQDNHKSEDNIPLSSGQPSESVPIDDSILNPSKEAKQMQENDGNQVPINVEISDGIASSLKQNPVETSSIKDEVKHDVVDDANNNERTCSTSNGTQPNITNLEKPDLTPNVDLHIPSPPIEVKPVETTHPEKTSNHQNAPTSDLKLDSSKTLPQDPKTSDDRLSPISEVKKESASVSMTHKVQNHVDTHTQSEGPPKSHGSVTNQRKITGKPSSKPSIPEKPRYSNSEGKQKENNSKIKKDNADVSEKPKKIVKELLKSSSTSALKSSHLSKSSHVPKKNSSDSKDPAVLSSSKAATTTPTPDSGDSANSLRCESGGGGANEQNNKSTSESSQKGEKINQINNNRQQAAIKHVVHPPPSTNLSDEELALLLHQELNSSPRVPRVPRMRHAGSLPQLASTTPTSTLMKRTSSSGGKDMNNGPRKRNKDVTNNVEGAKKGSRRHEIVKNNGSTNKSVPPVSTTVSSGPSSSNEANEHNMSSPQNASDDELPTHRTLPGLIAEIMSKGKRMTYEELCNAVLPHWPNLRKHNGERYAYSSHSQAVLDCLRNRSEWSRLVDRGPKTNAGRKRRKSEADAQNVESEEEAATAAEEDDDYSTDRNTKDVDNNKSVGDEFPKGKRKARRHKRLAMQGTRIKRRRKAEVVSDDDADSSSSSDSSEESAFSDEGGKTSVANEASASSES
ncbi:unnamed protein product [Lactuca virosa]|uniref:Zinc finger PHD-type domain-containing protein n=1 Tax=Lactuca virosa TaxID=75947 RepID=A0AAU9PPQ9_9ASTR|nr:unnamed protein product [Lactuca virosa]